MRRLNAVCALYVLLLAASACVGGGLAPVEFGGRFVAADGPPVEVRAIVQAEHRRDAPRYLRAAIQSLTTLTPWLGAYPHAALTIVDPPWHAGAAAEPSAVVLARMPWWSSSTAMAPELAAARGIARRSWSEAVDTGALPPWFVDGLVEYTARRVVIPLFQGDNLEPGYAMFEQRYFGGLVPRFVRIRLLPEADGDPLPAYRASPRADVAASSSPADRRSLAAKTVLTLDTLERWVGQPVFDGVLAEFARSVRTGRPTIDDFARVASAATGQDLSWLFAQTLGGSAVLDYAIAELTSVHGPAGGFDTTVVAARLGDGAFTGSSAPRVGPFESGRGLTVLVTFADGERVAEHWDGRDARQTFGYRGPSRAVSATIDPNRSLLLDVNRTNNSRMVTSTSGAAATRWAARWMMWLEHALLTYSLFA